MCDGIIKVECLQNEMGNRVEECRTTWSRLAWLDNEYELQSLTKYSSIHFL